MSWAIKKRNQDGLRFRRLWVVEMQTGKNWAATIGIVLTQPEGIEELADWRARNPDDIFRLRSYVPWQAREGG